MLVVGHGIVKCHGIFKNKRVGRGRAGRGPNLRINNDNNERGVTRQEVSLPHGRTHALSKLIPGLGGLSS